MFIVADLVSLSQMEFPTTINCSSPIPILGVLVIFFECEWNILKAYSEVQHYAVSDLDLHCFSKSHKNAWLKWVTVIQLLWP